MSTFGKKMDEWSEWFLEHRGEASDVVQRVRFLEKCVDGQFHLLWLAVQEIEELRTGARHQLVLPSGAMWTGSFS